MLTSDGDIKQAALVFWSKLSGKRIGWIIVAIFGLDARVQHSEGSRERWVAETQHSMAATNSPKYVEK